jgi:tetratricopeptide (TPR) repeat protein
MLEDLETRWRNERTPQAGVRLAEALQQQGDRVRAEGILAAVEARLESDPRDMASRVAVGAMRLALDQPADAVRALEQVVQADPTHLKANKLLIEVYVRVGRRDQARDRLDLYRLLNEGDPEMESLEELVGGGAAPVAAVTATSAGDRRLSLADGDPFSALTAEPFPAAAGDLLFELSQPAQPPAATATLGALYQEQGHHEEAERVFRDVIAQEPDNLRARDGLAALAGMPPGSSPATVSPSLDDDPDADRRRRIGALREYLTRIQHGRGVAAR